MMRGSVVLPVDPFMLVEVSPSTVKIQAISVAVHVCVVGFSVSVGSEAGLVSVFLSIGDVRLIQVNLSRVTSKPQFGIIDVTPCCDAAIIQSVVPVQAAAEMLALCRTTTQTPVVKLPVTSATQTAVIQVPLP